MQTQVSIDVSAGTAKLTRLLKVVEPRTLLGVIGSRLLSYVDESFRTRGRGQWAPLSPLTLLLRKHGGDVPLRDTGAYAMSYTRSGGALKTDEQTFVEVGSNRKTPSGIPLANIHELGTGPYTIRVKRARFLAAQTRTGRWLIFGKEVQHPGIPARPVLPTKAVAERLVADVVDGMLKKVEQPHGGG